MKDTILQYLKNGKRVANLKGMFQDDETREYVEGEIVYTDGVLNWTNKTIYHVEKYNYPISPEFRAHMEKNNWQVPKKFRNDDADIWGE